MKRIVLFTFTMLLGIFCYAQSEHLKFSGIPYRWNYQPVSSKNSTERICV